MKTICNFCGWEIPNADWYHKYHNYFLCDDCDMEKRMQYQKEREGIR